MDVYRHNLRNPLAMLLEAADDICYVTSDLNDAIKKKALSYEEFYHELCLYSSTIPDNHYSKTFFNDFQRFYKENQEEDVPSPFEYTMQRMTNDLKNRLVNQVVDVFFNQRNRILDSGIYFLNKHDINTSKPSCGTWLTEYGIDPNSTEVGDYCELLDCIQDAAFVRWIRKTLFKKHIYYEKEILHNELTGHQVITYLLDTFTQAVLSLDFTWEPKLNEFRLSNKNKDLLRMEKVFRLISKDFVRVFKDTIFEHKYIPDSFEHVYYRLKLVVDYVSGMTDSYALEIYRILNGT